MTSKTCTCALCAGVELEGARRRIALVGTGGSHGVFFVDQWVRGKEGSGRLKQFGGLVWGCSGLALALADWV